MQLIVTFLGALSALSQPGESTRSILISISIIPLQSFVIDASEIIKLWNSYPLYLNNHLWAIRLMNIGFILLCCINYLWIIEWSKGKSECQKYDNDCQYKKPLFAKSNNKKKKIKNKEHTICEVEMGEIEGIPKTNN